jgi:hypothetical protein
MRFLVLVPLCFVLVVCLSVCGCVAQGGGETSKAINFDTIKISTINSSLPQGETEIVADNNGHVAVVWMMGSPANIYKLTLRSVFSVDGGKTYSPDQEIAGQLRLADPAMDMDSHGKIYLSALRKDSIGWKDVATVLFRSPDFGQSWQQPVVINDDNIFNDRDWLDVDSQDRVYIVRSPRIPEPNSSYNRGVYYQYSTDGGNSFSSSILVNPLHTPGSSGGSARGIGVAPDNEIYIAIQISPLDNAAINGAGTGERGYLYEGKVGTDTFSGPFEFTTNNVLIAAAKDDELSEVQGANIQPYPRMKIYTDPDGNTTSYIVWIGDPGNGAHGVFIAKLASGETYFEPPRPIVSGPEKAFRLPTLALDSKGNIHVFWIQNIVPDSNEWALFYSESIDGGKTFTSPHQVCAFTFPIEQWPGDFISATSNDTDLFVAWAVAGGSEKGVYVSKIKLASALAFVQQ